MFRQLQKMYIAVSDIAKPADLARIINSLQQNVADCISPMASKIQNDSLILKNIQLTSGNVNIISHTLGRNLLGYNIMPHSQATIWDTQSNNSAPNLYLYLNTTSNVLIDLLVY